MARKFAKSKEFTQISGKTETEIIDAYSDILDLTGSPDVQLKHMAQVLAKLRVPGCYTSDILDCIQWFYDTSGMYSHSGAKWNVVLQLLRQLTISNLDSNDVSDIVDIDKLIRFCNRLVKFRDNHREIKLSWLLFVDASGSKDRLTLKDLKEVKAHIHLEDISDSILIDMLGCGSSTVEGDLLDFSFDKGPAVGIKDLAEVLGQLGEFD